MLGRVSDWGRRTYGEPCRGCGFSWAISVSDAKSLVERLPATLEHELAGVDGRERHPDLAWSVAAYVAHVGDNLRIWAERLASIASGGSNVVASYDENLLGSARGYDGVGLHGALWTLKRSVRDWLDAVEMAPDELVMVHSERGQLDVAEIVRSNAHDAAHHLWDIRRSIHQDSRT